MICSKILEKQRRTQMGLQLLILLGSPPLNNGVTVATFKASGKTPFSMDLSSRYLSFQEKKASLSSLIATESAGIVMSILFKKLSNVLDAVGIFLANSGPILVTNLLNSFAMPISLVTSFFLLQVWQVDETLVYLFCLILPS